MIDTLAMLLQVTQHARLSIQCRHARVCPAMRATGPGCADHSQGVCQAVYAKPSAAQLHYPEQRHAHAMAARRIRRQRWIQGAHAHLDEGLCSEGEAVLHVCQRAQQGWPQRRHCPAPPRELLFQHLHVTACTAAACICMHGHWLPDAA